MCNRTNGLKAICAGILAVALAASAILKIYYIREDSAGELLWNANEAYMFISVVQRGVRVSYLEYPWMIFKEYVGGVRLPDNERRFITVIQITPSGFEKNIVEVADTSPGSGPASYTPIEGRIYANYPGIGGLCIWAGDHFERATEKEQRLLHGISRLSPDIDSSINGWSKHGIGGGPVKGPLEEKFSTDVGSHFLILQKSDPVGDTGYVEISIYVKRTDNAPERIWYVNGHPRRVSKAEYTGLFLRR